MASVAKWDLEAERKVTKSWPWLFGILPFLQMASSWTGSWHHCCWWGFFSAVGWGFFTNSSSPALFPVPSQRLVDTDGSVYLLLEPRFKYHFYNNNTKGQTRSLQHPATCLVFPLSNLRHREAWFLMARPHAGLVLHSFIMTEIVPTISTLYD